VVYKKNIAVVFACYYLIICVGLSITLHFCGGSLESLSAINTSVVCNSTKAKVACCAENKDSSKNCCNDTVIDMSDVNEKSLFHDTTLMKQVFVLTTTINYSFLTKRTFCKKVALPNYSFQSNAPPLYKLFGNFTFYA
jgi:hypothetical protein